LLSGTVTALLKIDKQPIDADGFFINKFTNKLSVILSKTAESQNISVCDSIKIKIKKILSDCFVFLS